MTARTYTKRKLIDLIEGKTEMTQFDKNSLIKRRNKLEGITKVIFNLDEVDRRQTIIFP